MKELIRKILKEQTDVSGFCIPVNGWGKSLTSSQKFGACRNKKVKKLAEDSCSKCEKCRKGDKCIKCKCCRKHKGNDLTVNSGTPLLAAHAGQVTIASMTHDPNGYGGMIEIKHADGIKTRYGHCSQIDVKVGEDVNRGQVIGKSGGDSSDPGNGNSSHAHLHYEVIRGGKPLDPITDGYLNVECGDPVDNIVVIDDEDIDDVYIDDSPDVLLDILKKKRKKDVVEPINITHNTCDVNTPEEVKEDFIILMKLKKLGYLEPVSSINSCITYEENVKAIKLYQGQNGLPVGITGECRVPIKTRNHVTDNDIEFVKG
tara:strand:- start:1214 stop:2158 length:945 start_codon:yes stop_codon:yes gene_type:complete